MSASAQRPPEREGRARPGRRGRARRAERREGAGPGIRAERAVRAIVWLALSFAVGLLLAPPAFNEVGDYKVGDIAPTHLRAPRDLAVEDVASTAQRQSEARESVDPVYDYDEETAQSAANQVSAYFNALRQAWGPVWDAQADLKQALAKGAPAPVVQESRQKVQDAKAVAQATPVDAARFLGQEPDSATLQKILAYRCSSEIEQRVHRALEQILRPGVIGTLGDLPKDAGAQITLRRIPSQSESQEQDLAKFPDLRSAQASAGQIVGEWISDWRQDPALAEAATKIVRLALRPNVARNIQETDARREKAAAQVKPVYLNLKAGEVFVREGERIDPEDIIIISNLAGRQSWLGQWLTVAALSAAAAAALWLLHFFASKQLRFYDSSTRDLQFYAVLLVIVLALVRFTPDPWIWGGYVAYGALLVRLLLPADITFLYCAVASMLAGLIVRDGGLFGMYSLLSGLAAAYLASGSQQRLVVIRSGLALGALNAAAYAADFYLHHGRVLPPDWKTPALLVGIGVAGPVAFVYILSPLAERFFHYTSAIRLLELNDTNHPLVKDVFFKAPGTYQHSLVIGSMAEAAARAIGGDALLLRVAALYHDIGKTKMPQYFIENMVDGGRESPHNKLSPRMSAIIIGSHVKDGMEMGREAGLPERVIDMIPQHHGTKLMKYFWNKAKEQQTSDQAPLVEDDFRYPGPKPQSKEGGIMLLADSTEAAVRTLPEFTEARIRGAVQKIMNDAFADGQLSECDLTLKDLNEIAKSFTRTLTTFHHNRIQYPEPAEKRRRTGEDPDLGAKRGGRAAPGEPAGQEPREETLKRLGS